MKTEVIAVYRKLMAVRIYKRAQTVGDISVEKRRAALEEAHLTPEEVEGIYYLTALAGADERMVVPPFLREQVVELGSTPRRFRKNAAPASCTGRNGGCDANLCVIRRHSRLSGTVHRKVPRRLHRLNLRAAIPDAHVHLKDFQNAIAEKSLGQLQEAYTNAFDLRPDCTPNLGYHLFGDDGRRGLFLAELKGRMESRGIPPGVELPDHIALFLRYVDLADEEERLPVIEDCLLPAVARMVEVLSWSGNPYEHVLALS